MDEEEIPSPAGGHFSLPSFLTGPQYSPGALSFQTRTEYKVFVQGERRRFLPRLTSVHLLRIRSSANIRLDARASHGGCHAAKGVGAYAKKIPANEN